MSKSILKHLPQIIFVDLSKEFLTEIENYFKEHKNISFQNKNIRQITLKEGFAVVSPANSILAMTGGIDLPIGKYLFPGIQTILDVKLNDINHKTPAGRKYLPIGSAVITQYNNKKNQHLYLVSAPTMLIPQDVHNTQNAYFAFYATLQVVIKYNKSFNNPIKTLICPGFCTFTGKMTASESANQMYLAYIHCINESNSSLIKDESNQNDVFFAEPNIDEQPRLPTNAQFFD